MSTTLGAPAGALGGSGHDCGGASRTGIVGDEGLVSLSFAHAGVHELNAMVPLSSNPICCVAFIEHSPNELVSKDKKAKTATGSSAANCREAPGRTRNAI
jgi:hypothetical protein